MKKLFFGLLFLASFVFANQAKAINPPPPVIMSVTSSSGNNIISPTTEESIRISGTKEQGTDIFVNGVYTNWSSDPPDSASWHFSTSLMIGENKFIFIVKNINKEESSPVIITVTRNSLPENIPLPPVITSITSNGKNIVSPTTERYIHFIGTKESGTGILSNGYDPGWQGVDNSTEWFFNTELSTGENKFIFNAKNDNTSVRNISSPITVTIVFNGVPELTSEERTKLGSEQIKQLQEEINQYKEQINQKLSSDLNKQNSPLPVLKLAAEAAPSVAFTPNPTFVPQLENKTVEENLTKPENTVTEEFKPEIKAQEQPKKINEGFFNKISNFLKNISSRIWGWFN